jgi:hypothetical protein
LGKIDFTALITEGWQLIGFTKTLFFLFFWAALWAYRIQVNKNSESMQKQIDALAKENREYRTRFMKLIQSSMNSSTTKKQTKS